MILPLDKIQEIITTGKAQVSIPDHDDMYGWVCGYLPHPDIEKRRHIYSTLHDTANDHKVIVGRGRVYKINTGYKQPVLVRARCTMIHRGDNNDWVIHLEREAQP